VKQIAGAVEVRNRTPWDICLADAAELTENHSILNRFSLKKSSTLNRIAIPENF
jgi:hypothetical protein